MTLEEAEIFFKKYNGHGFHMSREDSELHKKFRQLNISKSLLAGVFLENNQQNKKYDYWEKWLALDEK